MWGQPFPFLVDVAHNDVEVDARVLTALTLSIAETTSVNLFRIAGASRASSRALTAAAASSDAAVKDGAAAKGGAGRASSHAPAAAATSSSTSTKGGVGRASLRASAAAPSSGAAAKGDAGRVASRARLVAHACRCRRLAPVAPKVLRSCDMEYVMLHLIFSLPHA